MGYVGFHDLLFFYKFENFHTKMLKEKKSYQLITLGLVKQTIQSQPRPLEVLCELI